MLEQLSVEDFDRALSLICKNGLKQFRALSNPSKPSKPKTVNFDGFLIPAIYWFRLLNSDIKEDHNQIP